jgi:hypothetical protein
MFYEAILKTEMYLLLSLVVMPWPHMFGILLYCSTNQSKTHFLMARSSFEESHDLIIMFVIVYNSHY